MITFTVSSQSIRESVAQAVVIFLPEKYKLKELQDIREAYYSDLPILLKAADFTGKRGDIFEFSITKNQRAVRLFFIGLGKKEGKHFSFEVYRRALGSVMKRIQQKHISSVALQLPSPHLFTVSPEYLGQQTAIIIDMSLYYFDEFITQKKRKKERKVAVGLHVEQKQKAAVQKGVTQGDIIGDAVNKVRHWIDLPPSTLTPVELAGKAKKIAKEYGLAIKVFDEEQIKKMGMGGLAGVSAGSDQDCKLVILEYKTKVKNAPTLAFVGKGITFDSGGLSLKPPQYMETMKEDMSGAAAVIGTMQALAQLKPKINVIGITPLSENLPSGKATKPGDIIQFYNGKTAEVLNTDAEGRLVLADALAYAVKKYKPDVIIDLATLTGACQYALGPFFTGMFSKDDELVKKIDRAAQTSGDRVWRLPLDDDYKKAIVSQVADIKNIGNEQIKAGATTAAFFLKEFVEDIPWLHLDIAGTAFNVPDISYYSVGATGVGVRLLVDLAMQWK